MGTFTTKLKLGGPAFGVSGWLDPVVEVLTVGQIRVIETLPSARNYSDDVVYKEEYMCVETGVGGGRVWTYGKDIFATKADAECGVISKQQAAHKERAERDARVAEQAEWQRARDLASLQRLKAQYETPEAACATPMY